MNKKFLKATAGIIAAATMFSSLTVGAVKINTFSDDLSVYYNNKNVYENSANKPIIVNDRTMVQIKPIFELMGFSSEYNDTEKKAIFSNADKSQQYVFIAEDSNIYKVVGEDENQSVKNLDVPAMLYNDTFYVPLRGFCEVFGMSITWIDAERKVMISKDDENKKNTLSFTDFIGEWGNISGMYLAQHTDITVKILSVDEQNKTIKLSYKYDMGPSGVWAGGSTDYSTPITVPYHEENVRVEVGYNGYSYEYKEYPALVTDPIEVMGSNKDVSSIIGSKDEVIYKFRLEAPESGNMYSVAGTSNRSCLKSEMCEKLN